MVMVTVVTGVIHDGIGIHSNSRVDAASDRLGQIT